MTEISTILDPNDPATRAAAFATTVRSLSDGVHPEHIMAVVSYLAREQVMTPTLTAQIGQSCRLLFAAAAELQ